MNPLTTAALDNKSVEVPIGVTVLTNKKVQNSQNVQTIMTGREIVSPSVAEVDAPGYEGKQVFRDNNSRLYFDEPIDREGLKLAEASFDDGSGSLRILRKNGTLMAITGFLRQFDFGVGNVGPRGDDGKDGEDAVDGIDGKDGPTGCAGPMGLEGRAGPYGEFGLEGDVGPTGPYGPIGITGPRGEQGKQGAPGFEGKRGPCGFNCPTTSRGPQGPQGMEMNAYVQMGPNPKRQDLIWAAPEDCLCPIDKARVAWVSAPPAIEPPLPPEPPTIVSVTEKAAPPIPCAAGESTNGLPDGPKEITGIYVETLWSDGTVETTPYDYGGKSCQLIILPCGTEAESGDGSATNYHSLGNTSGVVEIEYATVKLGGTAANSIDVYLENVLVATTGGPVIVDENSPATLSFNYDPAVHTSRRCKVVVGSTVAGEWWKYTVKCPVKPPLTEYVEGQTYFQTMIAYNPTTREIDYGKSSVMVFRNGSLSGGSNPLQTALLAMGYSNIDQAINGTDTAKYWTRNNKLLALYWNGLRKTREVDLVAVEGHRYLRDRFELMREQP